ncbi:hypothetical protein RF11_13986 [Thelohanellus kitauei]|uniref:Uncharacterized protein n=1 Tax=Thelohanellus kitauei TaxID=669202 RepID=A0A0C2IVY1_THEKT|nr:hypothetical protein RF11_13986 [Thelohanellus kitauei]
MNIYLSSFVEFTFRVGENENVPECVSNIADWSTKSKPFTNVVRRIYDFLMFRVLIKFEKFEPQIVEESLSICSKLMRFNILNDEDSIMSTFNLISNMFARPHAIPIPLCFKFIGCICNENAKAQQCLLKANLLVAFIEKFKNYFQDESDTSKSVDETRSAIQTFQNISNKNGIYAFKFSFSNFYKNDHVNDLIKQIMHSLKKNNIELIQDSQKI